MARLWHDADQRSCLGAVAATRKHRGYLRGVSSELGVSLLRAVIESSVTQELVDRPRRAGPKLARASAYLVKSDMACRGYPDIGPWSVLT